KGVLGKVEQYHVKKEYEFRGASHNHILLWIENAFVVAIDCPKKVCFCHTRQCYLSYTR
uniref:Helitron helicase-like domain-containing protein n=1 Tax=Amphimedon queenslandica TaxID=400682 RepID=A0A1X7VBU1_AMPQE